MADLSGIPHADAALADRQKDRDSLSAFLHGIEKYYVMHTMVYAELLKQGVDIVDQILLDEVTEIGMFGSFWGIPMVVTNQGDDKQHIYQVKVAAIQPEYRLDLHKYAGKVLGVRHWTVDEMVRHIRANINMSASGSDNSK